MDYSSIAVLNRSKVAMLVIMTCVWFTMLMIITKMEFHCLCVIIGQFIHWCLTVVPKIMFVDLINLALQVALTWHKWTRNAILEIMTLNFAFKFVKVEHTSAWLLVEVVQVFDSSKGVDFHIHVIANWGIFDMCNPKNWVTWNKMFCSLNSGGYQACNKWFHSCLFVYLHRWRTIFKSILLCITWESDVSKEIEFDLTIQISTDT